MRMRIGLAIAAALAGAVLIVLSGLGTALIVIINTL